MGGYISNLPFKTRMIILAGFVAFLAVCGLIMFVATYEKFDPAVIQQRKDQSAAGYAKLAKIYENNDEEKVTNLPDCTADMFTTAAGNESEYVNLVEYEYLARFMKPESSWADESMPTVEWLQSSSFEDLKPINELESMLTSKVNVSYLDNITKWKYVGVYYATTYIAPLDGISSYSPGEFSTVVGIADLETGEVICSNLIEATSSDSVKAEEDEFQKVLEKDMKDNTIQEIKSVLEEVSDGKLKASLY